MFEIKLVYLQQVKFLTIILATAVVFLVIKPGIDMVLLHADTEQACCGGHCTVPDEDSSSQDEKQKDDCSDKSCNPFQACSCCLLLCITDTYSLKLKVSEIQNYTYQSIFISKFAAEFWQPPKII